MTSDSDPFAATAPRETPAQGAPGGYGQPVPTGYGQPAPTGYGQPVGYGQPLSTVGRQRSTGLGILLFIVTFGIYALYWYYITHQEMKDHTGVGLGGPIALLIYIVFGPASPFLVSNEVGQLYTRAGRPAPVSALTGLWVIPGIFLLVLPIVWFVKTNGALNDYWKSVGAS